MKLIDIHSYARRLQLVRLGIAKGNSISRHNAELMEEAAVKNAKSWYVSPAQTYLTRLQFKSQKQEMRLINIAKGKKKDYSAINILRKALRFHKNKVAVLWSGGRCSTVTLHMAKCLEPNIKVIFVDTGVEFPETVRYVKMLAKEWKLNFSVLRPRRTFWELVKEHGPPTARKPSDQRSGEPDTPPCCYWLKKEPIRSYIKQTGIEALITGMRAGESTVRAISLNQKGSPFFYSKTEGVWKYHPLAYWTTKRVCEYALKHDIPMNPLYLKTDRIGCWPCTSFFGWKEKLSKNVPKFYTALMYFFGKFHVSPCVEGKSMNHLEFERAQDGRAVARILTNAGMEIEVHERGKIVCVPYE